MVHIDFRSQLGGASLGPARPMKPLGIIVFGHRRPVALDNTLLSLKRQGELPLVHVWVDGSGGSPEIRPKVKACQELAIKYPEAAWHPHYGRLGIEKLMLDGLTYMASRYHSIIVLEDDCFPTRDSVEVFRASLAEIENDPTTYSVYGHHFQVGGENRRFSRFQGWGWATTRTKLIGVLGQLKSMLGMAEAEYLAWTVTALTPEIRRRIDVTPGRNVIDTLQRQFSWDSATTLVTAILGLEHCPTPKQVIFNCGLGGTDSGHFRKDHKRFRDPPFNMIGEGEVWQYFNQPLAPRYRARSYFGFDELDRKLETLLPATSGFFVELGAHDGLSQTNTLHFERKGWRGLLVEAVPEFYEACRSNRPLAKVVHAACVGPGYGSPSVSLHTVGLMSLIKGCRGGGADEETWIKRGESLQDLQRASCVAPAKTLTAILEEAEAPPIDLLSLDVEGFEVQVLSGLDFERFAPRHIVVEDSDMGDIEALLDAKGYRKLAIWNKRNFTQDILFALNRDFRKDK